jgi:hypothetical protein
MRIGDIIYRVDAPFLQFKIVGDAQMENIKIVVVTFKTWIFKYFTPDKFLFVIIANGEPVKAIEVG